MHDAKVREVMLDRYVTRSAAELGIGQPDNGQSKCLASFLTSQNCHPYFPAERSAASPLLPGHLRYVQGRHCFRMLSGLNKLRGSYGNS